MSTPKFFEAERDSAKRGFGAFDDIADDLGRLGVAVARHPGRIQLTMDDMEAFEGSGGGIPVSATALHRGIVRDRKFGWLRDLVQHLHDTGNRMSLYVTFLTLGGGTEPLGTGDAAPTRLAWSKDHIGQTIEGNDGTEVAFDGDTITLAPGDAYKRRYFTMMAEAVGDALADLYAEFAEGADGIVLSDYLEALEIGNEVDVRDLVSDGTNYVADAASWGEILYYAGTALQARVPWLQLRFPGLASTGTTGAAATHAQDWSAKRDFVRDTLQQVDNIGGAGAAARLLTGIDLHYYHQRGQAEPAPDTQRLAYLLADVAEMREIFVNAGITNPTISVFEDGVTTFCEWAPPVLRERWPSGCEARDPGYTDYRHDADGLLTDRPRTEYCGAVRGTLGVGASLGSVGANAFQAMSVWMRLSVAAAAGARMVGWHTVMAGLESPNFLGTGLRRDVHDASLDPNVAEERASYHALQRMIRYLGLATRVERLTLGSPLTAHHREIDLEVAAGTWDAASDVYVIEFRSPFDAADRPERSLPYVAAYLIFVDPYGSAGCATVTIRATGATPESAYLVEVLLEPESAAVTSRVAGQLPETGWVDAPSRSVFPSADGSVEVSIGRGQWPVLIFSDTLLSLADVHLS